MNKRWPFSLLNWSEHRVPSGCWLSSWLRNSWMVDFMVGIFLGAWNILFFAVHVLPKKIGVRNSEIVNPLFLDSLCMCTDCYGSDCNLFKESMDLYLVRLPRLLNIEITRWFWENLPFLQLCNKFQSKFFIMKLSSPTIRWFMLGYQTCRSLLSTTEKQVSSPRWLIHMVDDE